MYIALADLSVCGRDYYFDHCDRILASQSVIFTCCVVRMLLHVPLSVLVAVFVNASRACVHLRDFTASAIRRRVDLQVEVLYRARFPPLIHIYEFVAGSQHNTAKPLLLQTASPRQARTRTVFLGYTEPPQSQLPSREWSKNTPSIPTMDQKLSTAS